MGKSLCDFSATPGAFAYTAANPSLCWSTKLKQCKLMRSKGANKEDKNEKSKWGSRDRWKTRYKSKNIVQRSISSNPRKSAKSHSHVPQRRSTFLSLIIDTFKNVCVSQSFQSSLAHHMFQRSKTKECNEQNCQEIHLEKWAKGGSTKRIQPNILHFLTTAAAVQCFMLERVIAAIVQMLLVRSGIETNPGPPTPAVRYY